MAKKTYWTLNRKKQQSADICKNEQPAIKKQQSSLFNINVAVFIFVTKMPFLFQSQFFFDNNSINPEGQKQLCGLSLLFLVLCYVCYGSNMNLACMYGALLKSLVSSIWLGPWENGVIRSNRISIYIHSKITFDP